MRARMMALEGDADDDVPVDPKAPVPNEAGDPEVPPKDESVPAENDDPDLGAADEADAAPAEDPESSPSDSTADEPLAPEGAGGDGLDEPMPDGTVSDGADATDPTADLGGGGAEADPLADVDPDTPVELPDDSNLEVDRLHQLNEDEEMKQLKAKKDRDTIDDIQDDLQTLVGTSSSLSVAGESLEELAQAYQAARQLVETIRARRGLKPLQRPALESFEGVDRSVVTESFTSTIKALFRTIINAILKALDWLKARFKEYFAQNRLVMLKTQEITDEIVKFRRSNSSAFIFAMNKKQIDVNAYVQMPTNRMWLTYNNKQPGAGMKVAQYDTRTGYLTGMKDVRSYVECFTDLMDIAGLHELFADPGFIGLCEGLTRVPLAIVNKTEYPQSVASIDLFNTIPEGSRPAMHFDNYTAGEKNRLYVREGFLGNVATMMELGYVVPDKTLRDKVANLGHWKMAFLAESKDQTSAAMKWLETSEIVTSSKASVALSDELAKQQKTLDTFTGLANHLRATATQIEGSIVANVDPLDPDVLAQYTELASAINAVTRNGSVILDNGGSYCRKVQLAWLEYLNKIYIQDQITVRAAE